MLFALRFTLNLLAESSPAAIGGKGKNRGEKAKRFHAAQAAEAGPDAGEECMEATSHGFGHLTPISSPVEAEWEKTRGPRAFGAGPGS